MQRAVETLDVVGFLGQLTDHTVLRCGNHALVYYILIGLKHVVLTIGERDVCLQPLGTPTAEITHMEGNHLACFDVHREPKPLLVRLLLPKAGHCIGFHLQSLQITSWVRTSGWACKGSGKAETTGREYPATT